MLDNCSKSYSPSILLEFSRNLLQFSCPIRIQWNSDSDPFVHDLPQERKGSPKIPPKHSQCELFRKVSFTFVIKIVIEGSGIERVIQGFS
jgi:hypothetical protein